MFRRTTLLFAIILIATASGSIVYSQQKPASDAPSKTQPTFGYISRLIFLPTPQEGGPVLPKFPDPPMDDIRHRILKKFLPLNPIWEHQITFISGAVNDNGDVAFAVVWKADKLGKEGGGVYALSKWNEKDYAEKRKVVAIGDNVAGRNIYEVTDVRINNSGQVS